MGKTQWLQSTVFAMLFIPLKFSVSALNVRSKERVMTVWRSISAALGIALVLIYAGGSNYWNRRDGWYQSLTQLSWQPPGFIFGLDLAINFVVIGIALYTIALRAHPSLVAACTINICAERFLCAALVLSFYSVHDLKGAALSLLITALLTVPLSL
jgi:tryptophan-rich sensory protein